MVQAERRRQQLEIRRVQIGVMPAAAELRVLDVADDAVAAVVHQHEHDVGLGIGHGGELAEIDHGAAVADERDGLGRHAHERRADRHGHALPDAAAERMHAEMRCRQMHIAVAECAVRERDVAHEGMAAFRHARLQRLGHDAIGTERRRELLRGLHARGRYVVEKRRVDIEPRGQALAQALERRTGIGVDEEIDGIVARGLAGIGVDLDQRPRQPRGIVAGLVAAQPRSHHDHEIGAVVDRLRLRGHIVGAERVAMRLRHHRAAVGARHDREAALGEIERREHASRAPPPSHSIGRFARRTISARASSSFGSAACGVIGPTPTCSGADLFPLHVDRDSSETGPRGAVSAARAAASTMPTAVRPSQTRK